MPLPEPALEMKFVETGAWQAHLTLPTLPDEGQESSSDRLGSVKITRQILNLCRVVAALKAVPLVLRPII